MHENTIILKINGQYAQIYEKIQFIYVYFLISFKNRHLNIIL